MPPSARNGAKGTPCLRAAAPRAAMIAIPTRAPGGEADEQRRTDGAAQEEAHHGRQLHVAHAHAGRVGDRGDQQEAARGGAGDQVLRQPARDRRASTAPGRAPRRAAISRLGMMRCSRSVAAAATSVTASASAGHSAASRPNFSPSSHEQRRRDRLDERIAHRDPHAAVAAAPAQQPATRRSGCCRRSGSWCRIPGSATAASRSTPAAAAGRRARSRSCRTRRRRGPAAPAPVPSPPRATRSRRPGTRPCWRASSVRSIVPVGSRCTLNVTGFGRVRGDLDLVLVRGRGHDREVGGVLEGGLLLLEVGARDAGVALVST